MTGLAVLLALAAAGCFAVSTAVQHHCAGAAPATATSGVCLLGHLLRRPFWLAGIAASVVGFVLHAAAVHLGALAVVQPVMVLAIVFALPARAALDRCLPARRAQVWAVVTTAGLALFIVVARPTAGRGAGTETTALLLAGTGAMLAALMARAGTRARTPLSSGVLLGAASGVLFGLVAGLLKFTVSDAAAGPVALIGSWHLWALAVLGVWGVALNQRAYQSAPLAVSLTVLNIVDVLVALGLGAWVFGEKPADQPWAVLAETLGLLVVTVGALRLTAPTTAAERRDSDREPIAAPAVRLDVSSQV